MHGQPEVIHLYYSYIAETVKRKEFISEVVQLVVGTLVSRPIGVTVCRRARLNKVPETRLSHAVPKPGYRQEHESKRHCHSVISSLPQHCWLLPLVNVKETRSIHQHSAHEKSTGIMAWTLFFTSGSCRLQLRARRGSATAWTTEHGGGAVPPCRSPERAKQWR